MDIISMEKELRLALKTEAALQELVMEELLTHGYSANIAAHEAALENVLELQTEIQAAAFGVGA